MPTKIVDERRLIEAGFILMARNVGWSKTTIWYRADEPNVTYNDTEAMAWLDEHEPRGKKARR